jgi:hypothetical protein
VLLLQQVPGVVTQDFFVVTGTARDDVKVEGVRWSIDSGPWETARVEPNGAFNINVPTPLVDEQSVTIEVRATDGRKETGASLQVRVDRVGPSIELLSPGPTDVIGSAMASVSVRAADASGALSSLVVGGASVASPQVNVVMTAPITLPANLARQPFSVAVSAGDAHGNVTTRSFQLLGDNTPPTVAITQPAADDTLVTSASLRLEGTVSDPTPPIRVRVAGLDAGVMMATLTGDGGQWFAELPVPLVERTESVRVEAEDAVGNVASATRQVRIDRVAPTVSIVLPAANSIHSTGFTLSVTTTGDAHTVEARAGAGPLLTLTGGPTSWSVPISVPTQDYGSLELVVTVRDEAGNSSEDRVVVFVDNVAPVITFTTPTEGRKFNIDDFPAPNNDVSVSWSVQDADPQAGTTRVNGTASTATMLLVTTSASDNGRVITTTVVAADRAGNTSTATRTFSVDRVRPTVTSWTPADLARNVEQRIVSISFSEPVFGATTLTDALALTPPAAAGSWNTAHTTWTSAVLAPYTVYQAALATNAMADDHGNAVAPATRRFSTSAFSPPGASDTLLLSNVRDFRAAADSDGIVTLMVRRQGGVTPGFAVLPLSPQTMTLGAAVASDGRNVTDYGLNAWSLVDATTLAPRHVVGATWFVPCTGTPCFNIRESRRLENGVATTLPGVGYDVVLSAPAIPFETDTSEVAFIIGTQYRRGLADVTLPFGPRFHAVQGASNWAAFLSETDRLRWSRFHCYSIPLSLGGGSQCYPFDFASPAAAQPTAPSMALNSAGQCLVASWTENGSRRAVFQQLASCRPLTIHPSCSNNLTLGSLARNAGFSVAPYTTATESTVLAAWQDTGGIRLAKMTTPSACTDSFTNLGLLQLPSATDFSPVQVGQRAGLLYMTSTGDLRLAFP